MDTNHLNILALLTDLCYAVQPILNKELPIVMTNSLYTIVKNYYINISPESIQFQLERARIMLFLCFQMTQVYLYEQNYRSTDDAHMMTNLLFKSLEASPVDRFQAWKNLLRLRVTWVDVLRVYQHDVLQEPQQNIQYDVYYNDSVLTEMLKTDPSWRVKPESVHQFYDKARRIVDHMTSAEPTFQTLTQNPSVLLTKNIAKPWAEPYFSALLTIEKTIEVLDIDHREKPGYKTENNILYDAVVEGQSVVGAELHILKNRLHTARNLHQLFDEWLTRHIVPHTREYRLPDAPEPLLNYYGPTTDRNNCYFNTVLVSMFMFPTEFLLKHLFLKRLQKTHIFDLSQNFCVDSVPDFNIPTLEKFRKDALNTASYRMSTKACSIIQDIIKADFDDRLDAVDNLQKVYQAFQTNNLQQINDMRNRILRSFISCRAMSNMPNIKVGDVGEPEGVVLFLENLLGLRTAYIEKTQTYYFKSNPEPMCENVTPEPDIFQYQIRLPESPSLDTIYSLQQMLMKTETNRENPACKYRRYNYFDEIITKLEASYICFTFQRTRDRLENRVYVDSKGNRVRRRLDRYKIIPNETLEKINEMLDTRGPILRLRAVIVYQPCQSGHYVCYVLNPTTDKWLYYNINKLTLVGSYEEMINDREQQVLEQAVMYFYG